MEDRGRGQVDTHPGLWPPSPSMSFKSCFEGKEIMDQWMPKIQEIFLSYKEASMKVCLLGAGDVGEEGRDHPRRPEVRSSCRTNQQPEQVWFRCRLWWGRGRIRKRLCRSGAERQRGAPACRNQSTDMLCLTLSLLL